MKLQKLLDGIKFENSLNDENLSLEVTGITSDSRKAGPGVVFVCIEGEKTDGHLFAEAAANAGCAAVIAQRQTGVRCR